MNTSTTLPSHEHIPMSASWLGQMEYTPHINGMQRPKELCSKGKPQKLSQQPTFLISAAIERKDKIIQQSPLMRGEDQEILSTSMILTVLVLNRLVLS